MGKNQQHKAMQKGRTDENDPGDQVEEGGADVSFHTAEWHAARVAALTTERLNWEDWKKQQKEIAAKASLAADEEERQMQEYRAQLDADRQARLARGVNNANLLQKAEKKKSKKSKEKKSKKSKKHKKSKKRADSSSQSSDSSSDSGARSRRKRKRRKEKGSDSDSSHEHGDNRKSRKVSTSDLNLEGPVRLSDFLRE